MRSPQFSLFCGHTLPGVTLIFIQITHGSVSFMIGEVVLSERPTQNLTSFVLGGTGRFCRT